MSEEKIYVAHPEYIAGRVELESGNNTTELYELEDNIHKAIEEVIKWRVENFNEKEWEEALPQTILAILGGVDRHASEVASKCFINRIEGREIERVEKIVKGL